MKLFNLLFCLILTNFFLKADIALSPVLGNGMVLQRETSAALWGTASPGETIEIKATWGAHATGTADSLGDWKIMIETGSAGGPYELQIQGRNRVDLKDVYLGDVWMMAGQSNMGHPVDTCTNAEIEKKNANDSQLRLFYVTPQVSAEPMNLAGNRTQWMAATSETIGGYGAVAYHFGRCLRKEVGVPIGLVGVWMGGTSIETWLPWSIQKEDPRSIQYKEEWDKKITEYNIEKEKKEFQERKINWEKQMQAWEAGGKIGIKPWLPPLREYPAKDNNYPSNLYNGMIHPVRHYTIKGVVWYQGEGNSHSAEKAIHYKNQLKMLTESWRAAFDQPLPFVIAQLPFFGKKTNTPAATPGSESENWSLLQESIKDFCLSNKRSSMAVLLDLGDEEDLHPRRKRLVGDRLGAAALRSVYLKDHLVWCGPVATGIKIVEDGYLIEFETGGAPLFVQGGGAITGFALRKTSGQMVEAQARLISSKEVKVLSPDKKDEMLYYAWASNPEKFNLYNEGEMPASPFRFKLNESLPKN